MPCVGCIAPRPCKAGVVGKHGCRKPHGAAFTWQVSMQERQGVEVCTVYSRFATVHWCAYYKGRCDRCAVSLYRRVPPTSICIAATNLGTVTACTPALLDTYSTGRSTTGGDVQIRMQHRSISSILSADLDGGAGAHPSAADSCVLLWHRVLVERILRLNRAAVAQGHS